MYIMKPLFEQRMRELLPDARDFEAFNSIIHTSPQSFIRCNTLKITPSDLLARLRAKWLVSQPFPKHPEILVVDSELGPGELGNSLEHLLGYYYVQEVSSMMSVLALNPEPGDLVLDVCASPGSKTTQIAAAMQNQGTLIANDVKLDRIKILSANLERCGVMNCVVTRNDGVQLCERFAKKSTFRFDKILLDAPCSGEGTLRSSPKTFTMWNPHVVKNLSRQQKKLIASAFYCLKERGILVYSTCTHAPEENEGVVDFALNNFPVELESLHLPLKCRSGINGWKDEVYNNVSHACRIYPQDNDSEGFFVARFRLKEALK